LLGVAVGVQKGTSKLPLVFQVSGGGEFDETGKGDCVDVEDCMAPEPQPARVSPEANARIAAETRVLIAEVLR
jgi:hypothetical protein